MATNREVQILLKVRDDTKKGFDDVNKNLGKIDKSLGGLKGQWLVQAQAAMAMATQITGAIGKIISSIGDMIEEITAAGDAFDKMSIRTSVSVNTLAKWVYMAELAGSNASNVEGSIRRMTKSMYDAQQGMTIAVRAWEKLGVSVVDRYGELRNIEDVMYDLADAFSGYKNETEALALSQDVLGRGGAAMVSMLRQGTEALAEQSDEYLRLHGAMKKTSDISAEWVDSQLRLETAITGLKTDAIIPITDALVPLINNMAVFVSSINDADEAMQILTNTGYTLGKIFSGDWKNTARDVDEQARYIGSVFTQLGQDMKQFGQETPSIGELLGYEDEESLPITAIAEQVVRDLTPALTAMDEEILWGIELMENLEAQTEVTAVQVNEMAGLARTFGAALENALSVAVFSVLNKDAKTFGDIIQSFVMPLLSQVISKLIIIKLLTPMFGFAEGGQVPGMASGGQIPRMASGGKIPRAAAGYAVPDGKRGMDSRMIMAMPGEEVINRQMSQRLNRFLNAQESAADVSPWDMAGGSQGGSTIVMNVGIPQSQAGVVTMQQSVADMLNVRERGAL